MDSTESRNVVTQYLQELFWCSNTDLSKDELVFTVNNQAEQPYIKILAYKKCTVVNVSGDMYPNIRKILSGKNRDEVFEFPLVYGQTIHYIPDMNLVNEPLLPDGYIYELLEGEEISRYAGIKGFDNSLVFDDSGTTSTTIVFMAKKDGVVVGIAGAGVVTDRMWEVGVDVNAECRNKGLGNALVRKLTSEILKKDILPFYSASVTNIGSQMVADRAGYVPCWVDTFGNIFDEYYAYAYENVIREVKGNRTIFDLINNRHSYRGEYKNTPVPRKDLIKIMQAGLAAPSGCNKQTTSLIAVDDPCVLDKLRQVIVPPVGETAPAIICVLTQRINAYRDKCFAVQDYSAAIENMLLMIVELGYQSCWYEGHITDEDRISYQMAQILGVPDDYELVCFLPVGIAKLEPAPPKKKVFDQRAWFNSFPTLK